jgi:N-carbamoyl-L-amino-acid hydrolase
MTPRIDGGRLWATIMETARFGATADGGLRRLTLSPDDRQVRSWLANQAEALGCTVETDTLGSMFIRRAGRNPDLAPIAMGSHLDSQPTGGKFDGVLGVLAGLEVLRTLTTAGVVTEHPLLLVNWTNEEGARFAPAMLCSGVYAGVFALEYALTRIDAAGLTFAQALEDCEITGRVPVGQQRMAAMFELHIEQGPVLEREGKTIGIVTAVQGARWFDVMLRGRAAHAGSTPMSMRADALLFAARVMLGLRTIAERAGGYATVGEINVVSPSRNVVPGEVRMTVDLRHTADAGLDAIEAGLRELLADGAPAIAATLTPVWISPPVQFHRDCIAAVRAGAAAEGYSLREITSGAGHDSVYVAKVAPTSMIFVPCRDGISHNPAESATEADCAAGAQVLLNAVLEADARTLAVLG